MINENIETVKNLLTELCDANAEDKGGKIFHLIQKIEDELKKLYENYEEEIQESFIEGNVKGEFSGYDEGYDVGYEDGKEYAEISTDEDLYGDRF
ncbi:MAG: hypothetical protein E3J43_06670 [Candidatus Heimdallarchaeota archaeon]|nr:MAG: hypothetical protein E3J43_06670 [Candidatus Heimdallarchaeota archaeon]